MMKYDGIYYLELKFNLGFGKRTSYGRSLQDLLLSDIGKRLMIDWRMQIDD